MATGTAKQAAREALDQLDDDATWDDIRQALHVREVVMRSLAQLRRGEGVSHEEMRRRFGLVE